MSQRVRKSLPPMDYPYEGIVLLLELVSTHQPTLAVLDRLMDEAKADLQKGPRYESGDEDILFFCWRQLGIVTLQDERFVLTPIGRELHLLLHTPSFSKALLTVLVEASVNRFSYFLHVYRALQHYVERSETRLAMDTFKAILAETNPRSGRQIRALLEGCEAIHCEGDTVALIPELFGVDPVALQIRQLIQYIRRMIQEEGRLVYREALERLRTQHPGIDINELEPKLRSRLRLNATRTVEYIDGILGVD